MGYREALEAAGAKVLAVKYFGTHDGEWIAKVRIKRKTLWISGTFGSCSICDAYERFERDLDFDWDVGPSKEALASFGKRYVDEAMSTVKLVAKLAEQAEWDYNAEAALKWVRNGGRRLMAYTEVNFKTKKALKEAIAAGKKLRVFQPGPFANSIPTNGVVYLEGPHYPAAHTWYAKGVLKDGILVKVT